MSSIKINGQKYRVIRRRFSTTEREKLGILNPETPAKLISYPTGPAVAIKVNGKWTNLSGTQIRL